MSFAATRSQKNTRIYDSNNNYYGYYYYYCHYYNSSFPLKYDQKHVNRWAEYLHSNKLILHLEPWFTSSV